MEVGDEERERAGGTAAVAMAEVEMQIRGLMIDPLTNMPIRGAEGRGERYCAADLGGDI